MTVIFITQHCEKNPIIKKLVDTWQTYSTWKGGHSQHRMISFSDGYRRELREDDDYTHLLAIFQDIRGRPKRLNSGFYCRMTEMVVTTGARRASSSQIVTTKITPSIYRPDALPVAQPTSEHWWTCHGLAYPRLTWGPPTLSLTTKVFWLAGGVAKPVISPLTPVNVSPLEAVIEFWW